MTTDAPKRQRRSRRAARPLSDIQTATRAIAEATGVRYDPAVDKIEAVLSEAAAQLLTNAFVHRSLWGVFQGVQSSHDLVPSAIPDPLCVSLTRRSAEVQAEVLSASGRRVYVQSYPCFCRLREGLVEMTSGGIRLVVPLLK